jgi:hypothetical protein
MHGRRRFHLQTPVRCISETGAVMTPGPVAMHRCRGAIRALSVRRTVAAEQVWMGINAGGAGPLRADVDLKNGGAATFLHGQ